MSNSSSISILLIIHLLVYLLHGHTKTATLAFAESNNQRVHIVYLGETQHDDPVLVTDSHYDMLTTLMGR